MITLMSRSIIQSLLYFILYPPIIPPHTPTPLMILSKIAQLHPVSSLMRHHTIPTHQRVKVDTPQWLNWEAGGEVEKGIKRRMRKCQKEGIWDLIWQDQVNFNVEVEDEVKIKVEESRKGRKRRRVGESDEEEEDGEKEGGRKVVSENGWIVLEWLVRIWEQDQKIRGGESSFPFLLVLFLVLVLILVLVVVIAI
jgi:hypothetical protein